MIRDLHTGQVILNSRERQVAEAARAALEADGQTVTDDDLHRLAISVRTPQQAAASGRRACVTLAIFADSLAVAHGTTPPAGFGYRVLGVDAEPLAPSDLGPESVWVGEQGQLDGMA